MLKRPKRIIVCESDSCRRDFVKSHYPDVPVTAPENVHEFVRANSDHGGVDGCDCREIPELIAAGM